MSLPAPLALYTSTLLTPFLAFILTTDDPNCLDSTDASPDFDELLFF
jgi:hypothetical protein